MARGQQQPPTTAGQVAAQVAYGGLPGIIDAAALGGAVALTMLWNAYQANPQRVAWVIGELLISFFAAGNSRPGRFRDFALGVEAGAIGTILAPYVAGKA